MQTLIEQRGAEGTVAKIKREDTRQNHCIQNHLVKIKLQVTTGCARKYRVAAKTEEGAGPTTRYSALRRGWRLSYDGVGE